MSICKHCKVKDICHNHIKCGKWCDGYVDTKSFYDYNVGEKIYYAGLMGKYFTVCTGTIERYEMSSKHPFMIANFKDNYSLLGEYRLLGLPTMNIYSPIGMWLKFMSKRIIKITDCDFLF